MVIYVQLLLSFIFLAFAYHWRLWFLLLVYKYWYTNPENKIALFKYMIYSTYLIIQCKQQISMKKAENKCFAVQSIRNNSSWMLLFFALCTLIFAFLIIIDLFALLNIIHLSTNYMEIPDLCFETSWMTIITSSVS